MIAAFTLLALFVAELWRWLLAIAVIVAIIYITRRAYLAEREHRARERAAITALVERADREHGQVTAGDERGVYGQAWPAVRDYRRLAGERRAG